MSKNVCSIYKYTVGMLYAAGRGQKGDDVKVHSNRLIYANNRVKKARKKEED